MTMYAEQLAGMYSDEFRKSIKEVTIDKVDLITQVRINPVVWKLPATSKTLPLRDAAWLKIASNVFPGWHRYNTAKKLYITRHVHNKWKYIRGYFMQVRRQRLSEGASAATLRKIKYAKHLKFVLRARQ